MKAGIYKRRDNDKHIYVAKDRSRRAVEVGNDGCFSTDGSVKVTTSEREQVVTFQDYTPDMQNLGTVVADRVADVPNGTTDHVLALQHYVTHEAPMPKGVFKTPNGNLVFVGSDHVIEATTLSPSSWAGVKVAYHAGINAIEFLGYKCFHYANVYEDSDHLTPQQFLNSLQEQVIGMQYAVLSSATETAIGEAVKEGCTVYNDNPFVAPYITQTVISEYREFCNAHSFGNWLRLGRALFDAHDGGDAGRKVWHALSRSVGEDYDEAKLDDAWFAMAGIVRANSTSLPSVETLRLTTEKGEPDVSHLFPGAPLRLAEAYGDLRSDIQGLLHCGAIRYVAGGEYEVVDRDAWREFWQSLRPPALLNAHRHAAFRPSELERWGQGACAATRAAQESLPRKPLTADEMRETLAKASDTIEKYRKAFSMSTAMRAAVDIEAFGKGVAVMTASPPCTPLVAADFSKLEERVGAALTVPYGRPGKSVPIFSRRNSAPAGKEIGFLEGRVVGAFEFNTGVAGVLAFAEFLVTKTVADALSDHGWYAEALAATRPRAVGKQSARKQRKKGRRVWWDAERNTRVWAPK